VENKNTDIITKIDKMIMACLLLMILIIPIIFKGQIINYISPLITDSALLQTGEKIDIYSYYKFIFLVALTVIISLLFLIKLFTFHFQIKKTNLNLFLILFILTLLVSTWFSSFKYTALFGYYDRHEGLLAFLCYSFIFFIASNLKLSRSHIFKFIYMLSPFILINNILTLLNFYGFNILKINFIKNFLFSSIPIGKNDSIEGTLYHMDYTSGITSVFICLFFILSIFEKRRSLKIVNIILLLSSFSLLLSSLASSGFITIAILLPIILLFLLLKKENKKFSLGIILLLSVTLIYFPLQYHDKRVWDESYGAIIKLVHKDKETSSKVSLPPKKEKDNTTLKVSLQVVIDNTTSKYKLPELPKAGIGFGSGRGYIWKNTLPIIYKQPLVGYGLDTYIYYFPQFNPNQISALGQLVYVDKPHSLYLGIAFGTGILGLVFFLIMIGIPIFNASFCLIRNKEKWSTEMYQILAILFALLAFLIQGIVNDANIGTDIIFFVFLGLLNSIQIELRETTL
jgi:hypothetical protein